MLREIDERKLINAYARYFCNEDSDTTDDGIIRENLKQLLDWDENGEKGLGIYCGKFESIKRKDWDILINFIKNNEYEIKRLSYTPSKRRKLESEKLILDEIEKKENQKIERLSNENYKVSGRGKKARPCIYKGKEYKSRQECEAKEGITTYMLYNYLKETGQL